MRTIALIPLVLALNLWAPRTWADTAEERAAADTLFQEARTLAQQKDFTLACPKFAASQKLDPKPGRLLALGNCYEQKGDTASAWSTFREATSVARANHDDAREKEAIRRAEQLEPQLTKLVLNVPRDARIEGLEVRRNGKAVINALWGSAFPVDPGPQLIEVTAPGRARWSRMFDLPTKPETTTVDIPVLQIDQEKSGKPQTPSPSRGASKKSLPLIITGGALGLVGLGTGIGLLTASSGLGKDALSIRDGMPEAACSLAHPQHADFTDACGALADKLTQQDTFINVGAGMLVVGGALAVGTLVYALVPVSTKSTMGLRITPSVSPNFAGVVMQGYL